jgi:hypothetical protein
MGPAMTREKSTIRIPLSGGRPDFGMSEKYGGEYAAVHVPRFPMQEDQDTVPPIAPSPAPSSWCRPRPGGARGDQAEAECYVKIARIEPH